MYKTVGRRTWEHRYGFKSKASRWFIYYFFISRFIRDIYSSFAFVETIRWILLKAHDFFTCQRLSTALKGKCSKNSIKFYKLNPLCNALIYPSVTERVKYLKHFIKLFISCDLKFSCFSKTFNTSVQQTADHNKTRSRFNKYSRNQMLFM